MTEPVRKEAAEGARRSVGRRKTNHAPFGLKGDERVVHVPLDQLDLDDTTFQHRLELRDEALIASIEAHGIQQALYVRPRRGSRRLQIVCGFRRAHAARALGLERVPVVIRELTDEQALLLSLLENHERKTISNLERAYGIQKLRSVAGKTIAEIAELFDLERRQVENIEAILSYPAELLAAMQRGHVHHTHALRLMEAHRKYDAFLMAEWVDKVELDGMSTQRLVKSLRQRLGGRNGSILQRKDDSLTINLKLLRAAGPEERQDTQQRVLGLLAEAMAPAVAAAGPGD